MKKPIACKVVVSQYERRYQTVKKSRKSGKPRWWTINGQALYNATMHYRLREKVTKYFHKYLSKYIKEQISEEQITLINMLVNENTSVKLGISTDIYEVRKGVMPDISNLWLWEKWFEDALQECKVIPDDNPDYVIESGRKRYHWVSTVEERKLVFSIYFIETI